MRFAPLEAERRPTEERIMTRTEQDEGGRNRPLKVLFIDPYSAYLSWSGHLQACGCDWDILHAVDPHEAMSLLQQGSFDAVVVAALSRLERDLGVLRQVSRLRPRTTRILLSPPLSATRLAKALDVAHRTLYQGTEPEQVMALLEQTVEVNRRLYRDKVVRSFAAFRQLPSPPAIYKELSEAINSDRIGMGEITAIVERDPALAARILRLVNSSYFGLGRPISNLAEALTLLGLRTVRGLALAGHLTAHYPDSRNWTLFSFERMNLRALSVARLAQEICEPINPEKRVLKDQAFLAGLLLDVGMLMLAAEQGEGYVKVMRFAARKQQPLHVVEQMAYGVTHAELGAYLLDLWNISPQVVEAVLLHHTPEKAVSTGFTPLSAVHIADALLPSLENELDLDLSSTLNEAYVEAIGGRMHLPNWKIRANAHRLRMGEAKRDRQTPASP